MFRMPREVVARYVQFRRMVSIGVCDSQVTTSDGRRNAFQPSCINSAQRK
jgi:hypothetical protein